MGFQQGNAPQHGRSEIMDEHNYIIYVHAKSCKNLACDLATSTLSTFQGLCFAWNPAQTMRSFFFQLSRAEICARRWAICAVNSSLVTFSKKSVADTSSKPALASSMREETFKIYNILWCLMNINEHLWVHELPRGDPRVLRRARKKES